MDINYSYFNTAKGYKVVGGTAAQFLKADGSVDSNAYLPLSGGTMTGAVNFSQGSVLQYNGSNRIRFGSSHTIISTDGTSDIYFRPKGDTVTTSSMILSNNGNLSLTGGMYYGAGLSITQSNAGLGPFVGIELAGQTTERLYAGAVASTVGGYIGQAKYITSNQYQSNTAWASLIKFGNNGDIFFYGDTGLTANTNYIPNELAKIDSSGVVANYFRSYADLDLQRGSVSRFRAMPTNTIISGQGTTGAIYFRPQGDAVSTNEMTVDSNGTLNLTSAIAKSAGSTSRIFNKVFQNYTNATTSKGILTFKFPQASTAATMFDITLKIYNYTSGYLGTIRVSFYKITGTTLNSTGRKALIECSDNFPSKIVNVGLDISGNVCINIGEESTVWGTYLTTEVERVSTMHSGAGADWSQGWSQLLETNAAVGTYQAILTIPVETVATQSWLTSTGMNNTIKTLGNGVPMSNGFALDTLAVRNASVWAGSSNRPGGQNSTVVNFTPYNTAGSTYGFSLGARNNKIYFVTEENSVFGNWLEIYHGGNFNPANYALVSHTHTWAQITNTPTTAAGYGITDVPRQAFLGGDVNSIRASDTRNTNPLPSTDLKFGTWFDFKTTSAIGLSGTGVGLYAGVITMVPYSDNSGNINAAFRIGQSAGEMYFQNYSAAGTWGTWNKILHTGNMASVLSGYITTNTAQTGLTGDKSTTGIWTFGAPIEINKGTARISGNSYGAINTRMHPTDYSFWGNPTGALVIILPSELQYQNNIEIDIIDNQSNNLIQKLQVNAYEFISYSKASLVNDTGSPDVVNRVRIGKLADNRSCIIINDINAAWSYPQMIVKKYVGGSLSIAKGTWTTQVMTDLSAITIQQEVSITKAVNSAALNGYATQTWANSQFSLLNHTHSFASLTSKPTTLSGFGITDGMSTNHIANGITSAQINNWASAYNFANNFAANNPGLTAIEALIGTDGYLKKDGNGQWSLTQATYTLPAASSTILGGAKLISDSVQSVPVDALSSVVKRTYGIQFNSSGKLVVNVPWIDTNTTYSNGAGINLTGTQFSANFGTAAGTIAQGNDPRIVNAIKLNTEFTINTDSGLILSDDYMGGECGIFDITYDVLLAGKEKGLHKFGAPYGGSGGMIVNPISGHMGYGGVYPTDSHNHYFNGTIRITEGIYSESSNGNDIYAGSGGFYNLDEEIKQEDKVIRLAPFDKVFSGTNNAFATKNRVVKITLNDGGMIIMNEFFVNQEITIMNISGDYATFAVNNTPIKVKIDPRSSATFYVNSENRMVMVRMDNDYCRILG